MEKDRRGLDSNVLRFLARMNTTKPIDQERRFIISYYLSDDTISVFEPPVRNSGMYNSLICIYFYFPFQNQQFKKNYSFFFLENYFYHTQISALLNTSTCVLHCKMCFLQSFNSLELKLDL